MNLKLRRSGMDSFPYLKCNLSPPSQQCVQLALSRVALCILSSDSERKPPGLRVGLRLKRSRIGKLRLVRLDCDLHDSSCLNFLLATSQSTNDSSPEAIFFSRSSKTSLCQSGEEICCSFWQRSSQSASISRSFSGNVIRFKSTNSSMA